MAQVAVEHPNVTLFRQGLEAFNSGDIDTIRSLLADDVVWHTMGRARYSGDTHGVEETLGLFLRLAQDTNGTLRLDVHDILANDTHAVALLNVHWEFDGKPFEDNGVQVVHIRDGKTTESWFLDWNPYLFDEQFPA